MAVNLLCHRSYHLVQLVDLNIRIHVTRPRLCPKLILGLLVPQVILQVFQYPQTNIWLWAVNWGQFLR